MDEGPRVSVTTQTTCRTGTSMPFLPSFMKHAHAGVGTNLIKKILILLRAWTSELSMTARSYITLIQFFLLENYSYSITVTCLPNSLHFVNAFRAYIALHSSFKTRKYKKNCNRTSMSN